MMSPSNADTHDKNKVGKSMETDKVKEALIESHEKVSEVQVNDIFVCKEPMMENEAVEIEVQQGDALLGKSQ